jgi:hypothetical protein
MLANHLVLACAALALLSCAKTAREPSGAGGADHSVDLTAGEGGTSPASAGTSASSGGSGTGTTCSHCPSAEGVQLCCDEYCGYLNVETDQCEPSVAGSRILPMVAPGEGELCPTRFDCESDPDCPTQQPPAGAPCSGALTCSYCLAPGIPRALACRTNQWHTLGPHPTCAYTTEP